jgi:UDPglucose 6-dehydrogenase
MANIAIIGGGGYVGLSYAAVLAEFGHTVTALDVDEVKIASLLAGHCPIYEPGLEDYLRRGAETGRIRYTSDYAQAVPDAEFVFLCVGTPPDHAGRADLQYVVQASETLARHLSGHTIIVNKSTLPVGSVGLVERIVGRGLPAEATFSVVSNPEFLREGSAIEDLLRPDRIVLGSTDREAMERVADLYGSMDVPVIMTDPRSAEMIKYAANAYLATKISFINEIALICERLGADVTAVSDGMGLDHRIGRSFLHAGVGFGGSCFPKDVQALLAMAQDVNVDPTLLGATLSINKRMREVVLEMIEAALPDLSGKTVTVLGLSFKPNTDDIREAPAIDIIEALLARGAEVRICDPVALGHVYGRWPQARLMSDPYAATTGADAVVLVTEWEQYRRLDLQRLANTMRGNLLVDGRRAFNAQLAREAGFNYTGIGHAREQAQVIELRYLTPYLTAAAD